MGRINRKVIRQTTAWCRICQKVHPAQVVEKDGKIQAIVECPEESQQYLIASDPKLYHYYNHRFPPPSSASNSKKTAPIVNYMKINAACNQACTICYAQDTGKKIDPESISPEKFNAILKNVKRVESKRIALYGGEPTLHPKLIQLIQMAIKQGIAPSVTTNGIMLAKDPELARSLRETGLRLITLQFDSLDTEVLKLLGRNNLEMKKTALSNILEAGFNPSFATIALNKYSDRLPQVTDYLIRQGQGTAHQSILSLAPVGKLAPDLFGADITEIINAYRKNTYFPVNKKDIIAFPPFAPWKVDPHPECAYFLPLVRDGEEVFALNRAVDLDHLYQLMSSSSSIGSNSKFLFTSKMASYFLRSTRRGWHSRILRITKELYNKSGKTAILNLILTNYQAGHFLEIPRISRCVSRYYTESKTKYCCMEVFGSAPSDEEKACPL